MPRKDALDWEDLPLLLTADEAAGVLRVHVSTVKQLCRSGKLHGVKVGRAWRIKRADLLLLLDDHCSEPERA